TKKIGLQAFSSIYTWFFNPSYPVRASSQEMNKHRRPLKAMVLMRPTAHPTHSAWSNSFTPKL
ncbi:hypothetical protein, partial [Escherichia coli]|uniref:hypothetical protein n=1 Tax=Escherichia coli TaxID=562 RepID=UPI001C59C8E1